MMEYQHPRYVHSYEGDFVSVYLTDAPFYVEDIDRSLSVHLSLDSNEIVGCTIYRVHRIDGFEFKSEKIELEVLLHEIPEAPAEESLFVKLVEKAAQTPPLHATGDLVQKVE